MEAGLCIQFQVCTQRAVTLGLCAQAEGSVSPPHHITTLSPYELGSAVLPACPHPLHLGEMGGVCFLWVRLTSCPTGPLQGWSRNVSNLGYMLITYTILCQVLLHLNANSLIPYNNEVEPFAMLIYRWGN